MTHHHQHPSWTAIQRASTGGELELKLKLMRMENFSSSRQYQHVKKKERRQLFRMDTSLI